MHIQITKERTWSTRNDQVILPKQMSRGSGLTILGAVGGIGNRIRFVYTIADTTNKENVVKFMRHFQVATNHRGRVVMYTDNHPSHRSDLVTTYCRRANIDLRFIPAYSSPLSIQERVWSMTKNLWSKRMSMINRVYNPINLRADIAATCRAI